MSGGGWPWLLLLRPQPHKKGARLQLLLIPMLK
jgi:hypothetical protein